METTPLHPVPPRFTLRRVFLQMFVCGLVLGAWRYLDEPGGEYEYDWVVVAIPWIAISSVLSFGNKVVVQHTLFALAFFLGIFLIASAFLFGLTGETLRMSLAVTGFLASLISLLEVIGQVDAYFRRRANSPLAASLVGTMTLGLLLILLAVALVAFYAASAVVRVGFFGGAAAAACLASALPCQSKP